MATPNSEPGLSSPSSSSSQLAERLRSSFKSQRSQSPGPDRRTSSETSSLTSAQPRKLTLEERLKASLAARENSTNATPDESRTSSPPPPHPPNLSPPLVAEPAKPLDTSHSNDTDSETPKSTPETTQHPPSTEDSASVPHHSSQLDTPPLDTPPAIQNEDEPPSPSNKPDTQLGTEPKPSATNVETLSRQLKLMEHKFSEVSESFKRLQAERLAADSVLQELTPVGSCSQTEQLRKYLTEARSTSESAQSGNDELASLAAKLQERDELLAGLRDKHQRESTEQGEEIESLRQQLVDSTTRLQSATSSAEADASHKEEVDRLSAELDKAREKAKDEEEKRVKAVTLLKTVRQKLVRAEKEKDEATKELGAAREKESQERTASQEEKSRLERELETSHAERDRSMAGLKAQFDKELAALRDRQEREIAALRGQFELDIAANKSIHSKELTNRDTKIRTLEDLVNSLTTEKNLHFEELQQQQASYESSQSHLESLQAENNDLRFRLRDATDRIGIISDEIGELRRSKGDPMPSLASSATDVARLLSEAESKYEVKLAEVRRSLTIAEKERSEADAQWAKRLRERIHENDQLRQLVGTADRFRQENIETTARFEAEIRRLQADCDAYNQQIVDMTSQMDKMVHLQAQGAMQSSEDVQIAKVATLEKLIEEGKQRESALRNEKKSLKEELRKVQSSAALLEKQRNPGVGYWVGKSGENGRNDSRQSISSSTDDLTRTGSPRASTSTAPSAPAKTDADINLEYLRNVILQFLEHKEMRPSLVKVLSILLQFTPQETRRLIAKV